MCFFNDALSVNTFAQDSRWQTNCFGAETLEGLDPGLFFESPVRFPRSWPSPLFGCLRARLFTKVKVFLFVLTNRSLEDFVIPFEFIMACWLDYWLRVCLFWVPETCWQALENFSLRSNLLPMIFAFNIRRIFSLLSSFIDVSISRKPNLSSYSLLNMTFFFWLFCGVEFARPKFAWPFAA